MGNVLPIGFRNYSTFEKYLKSSTVLWESKLSAIRNKTTVSMFQKGFEDTKGVIRFRKSQKNRQHNGLKKKYKKTNNKLQNTYIKLKIE